MTERLWIPRSRAGQASREMMTVESITLSQPIYPDFWDRVFSYQNIARFIYAALGFVVSTTLTS